MNLIVLGPPGSGKGTQAALLAQKFNLKHLSSGELLRLEAAKDTPKGKLIAKLLATGNLLPFETVLEVLEPVIAAAPVGFVLDGTPRDLHQAEYLDYFLKKKNLKIDRVIFLAIPQDTSLERLLKRAQMESRSDDTAATIRHRLEVYQEQTTPVIEFYRRQGLVLDIDGTPDIQTIFKNIVNHLTLA